MSDRAADELEVLLEGERAAILAGSYDVLPSLLPHKERLLEQVGRDGGRQAARLAREVLRNQTLLGAAIDGMRAATGQVSAIRGQKEGFQTYDKLGGRQQVGGASGVIERKV